MSTETHTNLQRSVADRVDALGWAELSTPLDEQGFAVTDPLLSRTECEELSDLFDGGRFRSTIDMARHRLGDGRYRYLDHPLPEAIGELRVAFYRRLAPVANRWSSLLGDDGGAFPLEHEELLARCRPRDRSAPRR